MRRFSSSMAALAALVAISAAGPARAENAFTDYLGSTANTFLTGLNGVLTFPVDPLVSTVEPMPEYLKIPGGQVTGRFFGFVQGTLLGLYRVSMGTLDMVFAPLPMATLSPEPRYSLVAGFEYEE